MDSVCGPLGVSVAVSANSGSVWLDVLGGGRTLCSPNAGSECATAWRCRRRSGRVAFVLVVEKDCIFHRLAQDGLPQKSRCAMVTGKGMPDLAARAMTWRLATRFKCPVLALTDCNPSGMNVALAYKLACKSSTLPSADEEQFSESGAAGLTASQVEAVQAPPFGDAPCCRSMALQRFRRWHGSGSLLSTWMSSTRRPCSL